MDQRESLADQHRGLGSIQRLPVERRRVQRRADVRGEGVAVGRQIGQRAFQLRIRRVVPLEGGGGDIDAREPDLAERGVELFVDRPGVRSDLAGGVFDALLQVLGGVLPLANPFFIPPFA
jgi:hypothetical protein